MNFLPEELAKYAEAHTTAESRVLKELSRETNLKVLMPQMLSGHLQGQFLKMLSCMIQPRCILEIGTFTGYSAICLAGGLQEKGMLHTIDNNEELKTMALKYFKKAGLEKKIKLYTGNGKKIIPTLKETFDLVFIDADKENYSNYYDLVFDKTRKGGFIIADNVLWSGKVLEKKKDKDTQALADYVRKVHNDNRVENILSFKASNPLFFQSSRNNFNNFMGLEYLIILRQDN